MKVLLTIEEYRERIIKLVMDVANKTINPNGDDYFKFEYIKILVDKCLTNHLQLVDVCNQMFINTFDRDRNGKLWCEENISQIDKKEAEEFNSQDWYVKFNEERKKNWWPRVIVQPSNNYREFEDAIYYVESAAQTYFLENTNEAYHISLEVFVKLYGYEYKIDRDFKCE